MKPMKGEGVLFGTTTTAAALRLLVITLCAAGIHPVGSTWLAAALLREMVAGRAQVADVARLLAWGIWVMPLAAGIVGGAVAERVHKGCWAARLVAVAGGSAVAYVVVVQGPPVAVVHTLAMTAAGACVPMAALASHRVGAAWASRRGHD